MSKRKKKKRVPKIERRPAGVRWPWLAGGIFALALLFGIYVSSLPEEKIVFDLAENMGLWQASATTKVSGGRDGVRLEKGAGDLYVVIPNLNLDAFYYDVAVVEMRSPVAYDQGRLLFLSPYNRDFDYNFRADFDTGKAERDNRIYLNLRSHPAWQGMVRGVLILPAKDAATVILKSIAFVKPNPLTRLRAWWSGFTYYRDPLLGTCFAMASPMFLGTTFNRFFVPFLWWFLVVVIVLAAVGSYLKPDQRVSAALIVFFFAVFLALWGLHDIRNNIVHLKAVGRNASLYWGRALQAKRGIVTGDPAFIDFMAFCDKNIPLDAKIISHVPGELPGTPVDYLSTTQFNYNLQPRLNSFYRFTEDAGVYHVFYRSKAEEIAKYRHLKVFKRYDRDAFILKE